LTLENLLKLISPEFYLVFTRNYEVVLTCYRNDDKSISKILEQYGNCIVSKMDVGENDIIEIYFEE
jgi:hypothetical protein